MGLENKTILIIGLVWPEPTSSAAGTRIVQLINFFNEVGSNIVFACAAAKSNFSFNLNALGVEELEIELNNSSFDDLLQQLNPYIVLFDRFVIEEQYGWRVAEQCPTALRILDTEDLHFLRYARQEAHKKKVDNFQTYMYSDRAKRELASILRSDLSLLISEFEEDFLIREFNISPSILFYIPFLECTIYNDIVNQWKSFDYRSDFVFIGNFIHEPNWQTVLRLKKEIWPLLSKKGKWNLRIYGAYPSQKVWDLHSEKDGFLVCGRAEDALEVIGNARVLLAPISFGAGVKGKFIDAFRVGTPSVTTTIGAESMKGDLEWAGFIADSNEEIAEKAALLYCDKELWKEKQYNGIEIINKRYSKEKYYSLFFAELNSLLDNLEQHRKNNFIGQVLMHHSVQSTKYMSLWIEEKNKNPLY